MFVLVANQKEVADNSQRSTSVFLEGCWLESSSATGQLLHIEPKVTEMRQQNFDEPRDYNILTVGNYW